MTIYPVPKPSRGPAPEPQQKPRKPMKKRNAKRGGHMFPKNVDEGLREYVRRQPCVMLGRLGMLMIPHQCASPVQVCHIKSRGAGGPDRNNVVAMCAGMHEAQHAHGLKSFQARWGVDLKKIAIALTAKYEAEEFPCP